MDKSETLIFTTKDNNMSVTKVLLVNPPWITRDDNVWHGIKGAMPPLSLLSIGAVLEQEGFEVEILDVHLDALSEKQVHEVIAKAKPDLVGISVMTSTAICSHRIAQIAKEWDQNCIVVMGGVHVHSLPKEALRNKAVDYVVRGDGEYPLLELCQGKEIASIPGLGYRKENTVILNEARPDIKDLSELPRYAYHLIDVPRYYPAVGAYRNLPAINMLMTRGCPGKCIFCNSAETTLRTHSAENMVDEIILLRDNYGIKEIQFYDDTFTVMKKNALEFCRLMTEKRVGVTFSCFARTDCFSEEMAVALKKAGCHQVMFGVESGSQEMLKIIRKDIDLDKTVEAVTLAKKVGIEVRCAFTFGTPGETKETIQETIDYAMKMDPDLAIFNITTPYPGTQMYAWAKKNDLLTTHDWWDYELGNAVVDLPTISAEELRKAYEKAYSTFYDRPIVYWRRLKMINSFRKFRDSMDAFLNIKFKFTLSSRGESRLEWLKHSREDFFSFNFEEQDQNVTIPEVLRDEALLNKRVA